jgi:ABC-type multidrug transport system ATPase subunit
VIVEARSVIRMFDGRRVLGPLDLQVASGERVAVTGPNGSGKSTLLRCIAGTVAPSSGHVTIAGLRAGVLRARSLIGTAFAQERSFYLRLTGFQNLLTFARLRHVSTAAARRDVSSIVAELELTDVAAMRVDACSTGMVQQLSVARALFGEPQVLLLDEPTRSMDKAATDRVWSAIDRRPAIITVLVSHRDVDVERCERNLCLGMA